MSLHVASVIARRVSRDPISLITSYQTGKYKPQNQQHASLLVMMANPDLQFKVKIWSVNNRPTKETEVCMLSFPQALMWACTIFIVSCIYHLIFVFKYLNYILMFTDCEKVQTKFKFYVHFLIQPFYQCTLQICSWEALGFTRVLFPGKFFENLLFGGLFISISITCSMEIEKPKTTTP